MLGRENLLELVAIGQGIIEDDDVVHELHGQFEARSQQNQHLPFRLEEVAEVPDALNNGGVVEETVGVMDENDGVRRYVAKLGEGNAQIFERGGTAGVRRQGGECLLALEQTGCARPRQLIPLSGRKRDAIADVPLEYR